MGPQPGNRPECADLTITNFSNDEPPHHSPARLRTRARSWSTRTLVTTSVASFVCGALVWHMIGFWSFVSGIMFNPDDTPPSIGRPDKSEQIATATGTSDTAVLKRTAHPTATSPTRKAPETVNGVRRPRTSSETLADLLQCAEARRETTGVNVHACPPLRQRLPHNTAISRANRQLDAREAARLLAEGWQTGVATIETGSLQRRR